MPCLILRRTPTVINVHYHHGWMCPSVSLGSSCPSPWSGWLQMLQILSRKSRFCLLWIHSVKLQVNSFNNANILLQFSTRFHLLYFQVELIIMTNDFFLFLPVCLVFKKRSNSLWYSVLALYRVVGSEHWETQFFLFLLISVFYSLGVSYFFLNKMRPRVLKA